MPSSAPLAYARFDDRFHACAFVTGEAEERAVIEPFLVEGMNRREKAVYIVDPQRREEHETQLRSAAPAPEPESEKPRRSTVREKVSRS